MRKAKLYMDTVVDIQVVLGEGQSEKEAKAKIQQAFEAFQHVEQACSRFSPDSELMRACRQVDGQVPITPFLYEPIKFALEMAEWTDGVFDPTVGKVMEDYGFNRHYLTGETLNSTSADSVTYRDIELNEQERTLYLKKPLVIDLGAVAKGFAIDLAANALNKFPGFVVNAGGDLFAGGLDESGEPWKIGIQHPEHKDQIIHTVTISDAAICTSGSYERPSPKAAGVHHVINPKTGKSPNDWISCSVIAPFAMMADAFSTSAFLLGAGSGERLIEEADLQGILISSDLQIVTIGGI